MTTLDELLAWHRWEAAVSEENRQWAAALFHLDKLLALQPADPSFAERRVRAERALADQARGSVGQAK
jgi:hypothetical protein